MRIPLDTGTPGPWRSSWHTIRREHLDRMYAALVRAPGGLSAAELGDAAISSWGRDCDSRNTACALLKKWGLAHYDRPRRRWVAGPRGSGATEEDLGRRFKGLLEDAIGLARERGATAPEIYFECDGGLLVIDGEHHSGREARARQDRIIVDVGWPDVGVMIDVGAW